MRLFVNQKWMCWLKNNNKKTQLTHTNSPNKHFTTCSIGLPIHSLFMPRFCAWLALFLLLEMPFQTTSASENLLLFKALLQCQLSVTLPRTLSQDPPFHSCSPKTSWGPRSETYSVYICLLLSFLRVTAVLRQSLHSFGAQTMPSWQWELSAVK